MAPQTLPVSNINLLNKAISDYYIRQSDLNYASVELYEISRFERVMRNQRTIEMRRIEAKKIFGLINADSQEGKDEVDMFEVYLERGRLPGLTEAETQTVLEWVDMSDGSLKPRVKGSRVVAVLKEVPGSGVKGDIKFPALERDYLLASGYLEKKQLDRETVTWIKGGLEDQTCGYSTTKAGLPRWIDKELFIGPDEEGEENHQLVENSTPPPNPTTSPSSEGVLPDKLLAITTKAAQKTLEKLKQEIVVDQPSLGQIPISQEWFLMGMGLDIADAVEEALREEKGLEPGLPDEVGPVSEKFKWRSGGELCDIHITRRLRKAQSKIWYSRIERHEENVAGKKIQKERLQRVEVIRLN